MFSWHFYVLKSALYCVIMVSTISLSAVLAAVLRLSGKVMTMKAMHILCTLLLGAVILCGCGRSAAEYDEKGSALITSEWQLAQMTVRGSKTDFRDVPDSVWNGAASNHPAFVCTDGTSCVFSSNGTDHKGKLSPTDNGYVITFSDDYKSMKAVISGDELTLSDNAGTYEIVFETKNGGSGK